MPARKRQPSKRKAEEPAKEATDKKKERKGMASHNLGIFIYIYIIYLQNLANSISRIVDLFWHGSPSGEFSALSTNLSRCTR